MATKNNPVPEIHGHRGARGLLPENSLVAIEAGISLGCDAIEVDLCVTRDDQLVIHHDPVLSPSLVRDKSNCWINREIRIRELNLVEVKTYDVGRIKPGSDYAARFHSQTPVDGTRIPALGEFVKLVDGLESRVIYNLELKSTPYDLTATPGVDKFIELVAGEIEIHKIADRVFLQSFDWRLVIGIKKFLPWIKTGFLTNQQPDSFPVTPISGKPTLWTNNQDVSEFDNHIPGMIKFLGGDVWSCNQLDLNKDNVQSAHDLGLEVYAWTVNSKQDMLRMIEIEVDAITTDYPDRLALLLDR